MGIAGLANLGAGAAGAAAGGGLPWKIILPIALSFFSSQFGGGEDPEVQAILDRLEMQKNMQMFQQMGMRPPYQSPHIAGLDKVSIQAILNQLGRSGNWGWPEGKGMDMSFIEDLLGNIGSGGITTPTGRNLIRR